MVDKSKLGQPVGITLDRFIKNKQDEFSFATGELSQILRDIGLAGKIINREISRAGLVDLGGSVGEQNIQGETQQKLDVIANIRFKRALRNGGEVCAIVSEEDDGIIDLNNPHGKYIVAIDPLDGSSNIDVNVSIGTIFSVYRRLSSAGGPVLKEDVLQKGSKQVAAGYLLYGSSTMLVYSTGHGVNGFTYDPSLGEFFLSHPDMKTPADGSIYSVNEGGSFHFSSEVRDYIQYCKENNFTARYIGSLVGDFHRNLLKGGIYLYPATAKSPKGKLRLLYECNALSYLIEQAGGKATDGQGNRILDILPKDLHQRTPFFIGSKLMMDVAESFLTKSFDTAPVA